MTVTRTRAGLSPDVAMPRPADILISDIIDHLSKINRYGGASEFPISVAQHSLIVARILAEARQPVDVCFMGLLHDAHEAYTGDITTPMKQLVGYRPNSPSGLFDAEVRLDRLIYRYVGLNPADIAHGHQIVGAADLRALNTEWRDAMAGPCPHPAPPANFSVKEMHWTVAKGKFLDAFRRLAVACGLNPDPDGEPA